MESRRRFSDTCHQQASQHGVGGDSSSRRAEKPMHKSGCTKALHLRTIRIRNRTIWHVLLGIQVRAVVVRIDRCSAKWLLSWLEPLYYHEGRTLNSVLYLPHMQRLIRKRKADSPAILGFLA